MNAENLHASWRTSKVSKHQQIQLMAEQARQLQLLEDNDILNDRMLRF